jgi:hypothetical protein
MSNGRRTTYERFQEDKNTWVGGLLVYSLVDLRSTKKVMKSVFENKLFF